MSAADSDYDRTSAAKFMPAPNINNASQNGGAISAAATRETTEVLQSLGSSPGGLTEAEAEARLDKYGPNEVGQEKKHEWLHRLWTAVRNPLVILLTVLATISYATGDLRAGTVILLVMDLGKPVARAAAPTQSAATIAPPPTMRVVRQKAPLAPTDYAMLDRPTVHRQARAVGDGLRTEMESEDLLDIPAFLRRQAD